MQLPINGVNDVIPYMASIQRVGFIFLIVLLIVVFISKSLMFEDNNAKCWYLIIPFYNLYTEFKIFWDKKYFYFYLIPFIIAFISILTAGVTFLSILISSMAGIGYGTAVEVADGVVVLCVAGIVVWFICLMIMEILEIILNYHISKTYNYDGGFTVGLIILPVVFYAILGIKCIKAGVLRKISAGRKVFMFICVALLVALTALLIYYNIV